MVSFQVYSIDLFKYYATLSVFTPCIYLNSMVSYSMDLFKLYGILSVSTPRNFLNSMGSCQSLPYVFI